MKVFIVAVLAFFVGMLLGRLAPQSELTRLQKQLDEKADAPRRAAPTLDPLAGMFVEASTPAEDTVESTEDPAEPADEPSLAVSSNGVAIASKEGDDDELTDLERRIEAATKVWDVRKGIVRQGFIDRVGINEDELIVFDTAIAAMNLRLEATFRKWADVLESVDVPSAELGVKMGHEITEAMSLAYDDLDRGMPEGWRDASGENFSMGDFIDPTVALPLLSVEDKLRGFGGP